MLLLESLASNRSVDGARVPLRHAVPTSAPQGRLYFHCALGFATQTLAYVLDSLVRVSRRANCNHFVSPPNAPLPNRGQRTVTATRRALLSAQQHHPGPRGRSPKACVNRSSVQREVNSPAACKCFRRATRRHTSYLATGLIPRAEPTLTLDAAQNPPEASRPHAPGLRSDTPGPPPADSKYTASYDWLQSLPS